MSDNILLLPTMNANVPIRRVGNDDNIPEYIRTNLETTPSTRHYGNLREQNVFYFHDGCQRYLCGHSFPNANFRHVIRGNWWGCFPSQSGFEGQHMCKIMASLFGAVDENTGNLEEHRTPQEIATYCATLTSPISNERVCAYLVVNERDWFKVFASSFRPNWNDGNLQQPQGCYVAVFQFMYGQRVYVCAYYPKTGAIFPCANGGFYASGSKMRNYAMLHEEHHGYLSERLRYQGRIMDAITNAMCPKSDRGPNGQAIIQSMYLLRRFHATESGASFFYYNAHTVVPPADDGVGDMNVPPVDNGVGDMIV